MDIIKIKTLIEMLQESNLAEIEVKDGDTSVRLSKKHIKNDESKSTEEEIVIKKFEQ